MTRGDVDTLSDVAAKFGLERMGLPSSPNDVRDYAAVLKKMYSELVPGFEPRRLATKEQREKSGGVEYMEFRADQVENN